VCVGSEEVAGMFEIFRYVLWVGGMVNLGVSERRSECVCVRERERERETE
jgi:hypothetical protein